MTHDLQVDPVLGPLIERYGPLELKVAEDPFQRLVTAIVNQQLSLASARAIRRRLFDGFEISPSALRDADPAALADVGLSARKIEYLRGVAERFDREDLTRGSLERMSDEAVVDRLTSMRGVGVWTAKMFLMFALGREDVFPVEDLGIRKGMRSLYGNLSVDEMIETADPWRPHRSRASLYVWRVVHDDAGR